MTVCLTPAEKLDWLQLCRSGGIGPKTFFRLLHRFGSAARAFEELPRLAAAVGSPTPPRCRRHEAEAEIEALARKGWHLIGHGEPGYPARLANIHDPPPVITVRGELSALQLPAVAIVGARNASANGRLIAGRMARELAECGLAVVSGLARGIDTAVHQGALDGGGRTAAVIASGVDIAYPEENEALMAAIGETGAVISERPLGAAPQARHFPRRNRLISGMAIGVVVVEAAPNSGSLITARMAAEQGREVMAVPGSPLDPRHRGTNRLLRDGAILVESAEDVLEALGGEARPTGAASSGRAAGRHREADPSLRRNAHSANAAAALPTTLAPPSLVPDQGGEEEKLAERVCKRLSTEPLLVDELIRQCHANSSEMQHALLELELEGRIERHPGNRVSLTTL